MEANEFWPAPRCQGGRSLIIITPSSHHHHTSSQVWPGVTAPLVPPSPQSHSLTHLWCFVFVLFIFPWLDDSCCCLLDLGAVRRPNVLIRVGGAGSRALMEAHAHTTSCAAENIYLSCRHNYHKATVYRCCFKCLVYRFYLHCLHASQTPSLDFSLQLWEITLFILFL